MHIKLGVEKIKGACTKGEKQMDKMNDFKKGKGCRSTRSVDSPEG
jgi:hypothetical protein